MNQTRGWQAMTLLLIIAFLYLFKILLYDDIRHFASTIYSKQAGNSVVALTETDTELNLLKHQQTDDYANKSNRRFQQYLQPLS
jgi:hypothetical protein